MARFSDLPNELLDNIVVDLDHGSLLRLSSASKSLRATLAPRVFKAIRFSTTPKVADSALAAAKKYGRYTEKLCFVGPETETDPSPKWDHSKDKRVPITLPSSGRELLERRAELFPNLASCSVALTGYILDDWTSDGADEEDLTDLQVEWEGEAECERVRGLEQVEGAYRLVRDVLTSLARGGTRDGEHLFLDEWFPRWSSVFETSEWSAYLGRLDSFDMFVYGWGNGAGWHCNHQSKYCDEFQQLASYFFHHLASVTKVKLTASEMAPLGIDVLLELQPATMPRLEHLELANVFLNSSLVNFIAEANTKHSLRSVTLRGAVAANWSWTGFPTLSWIAFFNTLVERGVRLDSFVLETIAPLTREEEFPSGASMDEIYSLDPPEVAEIRQTLKNNPDRRLFGYSYIDDKYGMWFFDEEENVRSFCDGEDQRAYDAFMKTVKQN